MIRAPQRVNGSFISKHFFPGISLKNINSGRCYDWAYIAHRLFGADLWTTDYHAWVSFDYRAPGYHTLLYFDSESPNGVKNFMRLGCNVRNAFPLPWGHVPPHKLDLDEFKSFWNTNGAGYKFHWKSMLEESLKRVLKDRFKAETPIFNIRPDFPFRKLFEN